MNVLTKSRTLLLAACVVMSLAPLSLHAQKVKPNPDPGIPGEGYVDYVGRYGAVFKLNDDWQIVPSMRGKIEVLDYYPKYRDDLPPGSLDLFKPKPSDFTPEKFSRLGLIQLVIIPRSSDAFRSLDELKKAKIDDLRASGVTFRVLDEPFFGQFYGRWPEGTFDLCRRHADIFFAAPAARHASVNRDSPHSTIEI